MNRLETGFDDLLGHLTLQFRDPGGFYDRFARRKGIRVKEKFKWATSLAVEDRFEFGALALVID